MKILYSNAFVEDIRKKSSYITNELSNPQASEKLINSFFNEVRRLEESPYLGEQLPPFLRIGAADLRRLVFRNYKECLGNANIKSKGLTGLMAYIDKIYKDNAFKELKQDIANLKASTSNLKSVTVGINLNERFEAKEIGLISINAKAFTKSSVLIMKMDRIASK